MGIWAGTLAGEELIGSRPLSRTPCDARSSFHIFQLIGSPHSPARVDGVIPIADEAEPESPANISSLVPAEFGSDPGPLTPVVISLGSSRVPSRIGGVGRGRDGERVSPVALISVGCRSLLRTPGVSCSPCSPMLSAPWSSCENRLVLLGWEAAIPWAFLRGLPPRSTDWAARHLAPGVGTQARLRQAALRNQAGRRALESLSAGVGGMPSALPGALPGVHLRCVCYLFAGGRIGSCPVGSEMPSWKRGTWASWLTLRGRPPPGRGRRVREFLGTCDP